MTEDKLHEGDCVSWRSHGSTTEGEVIEEITEDTKAAGRTVRASQDDPQYRVRPRWQRGDLLSSRINR
jgi:hypothetical protein